MKKERIPLFVISIIAIVIASILLFFTIVSLIDISHNNYAKGFVTLNYLQLACGIIMIVFGLIAAFVTFFKSDKKYRICALILLSFLYLVQVISVIYLTVHEDIQNVSIKTIYYLVIVCSFIVTSLPLFFILKIKPKKNN